MGSFLLMLVQLHLKFESKTCYLYLISNKNSEASEFYNKMNFVTMSADNKVDLPKTVYDDDPSMIKLFLSSLITKQMYYNYPVLFNVNQIDKESNQGNLLQLIQKLDIQFDMEHETILTFPFFSHGEKLEAILTKGEPFFFF